MYFYTIAKNALNEAVGGERLTFVTDVNSDPTGIGSVFVEGAGWPYNTDRICIVEGWVPWNTCWQQRWEVI